MRALVDVISRVSRDVVTIRGGLCCPPVICASSSRKRRPARRPATTTIVPSRSRRTARGRSMLLPDPRAPLTRRAGSEATGAGPVLASDPLRMSRRGSVSHPRSQWNTAAAGIRALVATMVATSAAVLGPGAMRAQANSAVAASQPKVVYVATLRHGVLRSEDSGETWTDPGDDPDEPQQTARLVVDPTDPDRLYAGAAVGTVRAWLRGEHAPAGRFVRDTGAAYLRFAPRRVTPIYVGAMSPHMLRLCGELADGALPLLFPPEHYATARRLIDEGAQRRDATLGEISEELPRERVAFGVRKGDTRDAVCDLNEDVAGFSHRPRGEGIGERELRGGN